MRGARREITSVIPAVVSISICSPPHFFSPRRDSVIFVASFKMLPRFALCFQYDFTGYIGAIPITGHKNRECCLIHRLRCLSRYSYGGKWKAHNMSTTRGECKQVGGKLVGVTLTVEDNRILACHVDGDFFISANNDDMRFITAIEHSIEALSLPLDARTVLENITHAIHHYPQVTLIGATAQSITQATLRALAHTCGRGIDILHDEERSQASQSGQRVESSEPLAVAKHQNHEEAYTLSKRWNQLHPLIIHDTPRNPSMQMALDEVLSHKVADGSLPAMIRIWEWKSSAVIIGRYQSLNNEVNLEQAATEGISVVRRVTGGGAMFVEPSNTITYSLYAPLSFVQDIDVPQSYRSCDEWLVAALQELGMNVSFSSMNDLASEQGKIGGAAQRRFARKAGGPGAVLHHVTLAYDIDAEKMARILRISKEKMSDKAVKSVVKRVDPMRSQTGMSRSAIIAHLYEYLLDHVAQAQAAAIPATVLDEAHKLAHQRFSQDSWLSCIV